jgi:putative phosphoesterase
LLRPEAIAHLNGVDHIIHAGDIGAPDIIPRLEKVTPVTAIKGNIDQADWAVGFEHDETLRIAGHKIFVLHNRNELPDYPGAAGSDIIISGHSHKPNIETIDGVLYLNPGSAGPRRFTLPIALAVLEMDEGILQPRIHEISS